MTETSRVLTLVFTDLADSTALKARHGDQAVDKLLTRHREHVVRLAEVCAGRIIDWAGDGCFLTFETSSAGVMFALRLEQVHAEEKDLPGVRIGIHMGEVTDSIGPNGAPQVKGLAVDLAARIQSLARPGQVLMSSSVYHSARQRLGVDAFGKPVLWQTYGDYSLKGFDDPLDICEAGLEGLSPLQAPEASEKAYPLITLPDMAASANGRRAARFIAIGAGLVLLAAIAGAYWYGRSKTPPAQPIDADAAIASLAVLPLNNLMNDPDQDYFVDGMTEAITAELAKIQSLKVVSRTSVTQYKNTKKTIPTIAAELGVEGLIEGSVFRAGDDVRITVQLIDGASDTHVWSESYTNTITSVLQLQSDVALAIADAIRATVTPTERERIAAAKPVNREAYEAYLKAWLLLDVTTEENVTRALQYLEQAQAIDPNMAEAWAAEARAHWIRAIILNWPMQSQIEHVRVAASRALALDGTQAYGHVAMGSYAMVRDHDWDTAKRHYERAVELSPNEPLARFYLGNLYCLLGDWRSAIEQADEIVRLSPEVSYERFLAATVLDNANATDRALQILENLNSADVPRAPWRLAIAYSHVGDTESALRSAREMGDVGVVAAVLAQAGRYEESREVIDRIEAAPPDSRRNLARANELAAAYVWMDDLDDAFYWIGRGYDSLEPWAASVLREAYVGVYRNDPRWVAFRNDPRYWGFRQRMRLPPLPPEHPGYAEEQAWLERKKADGPIKKIAVLPFDNLMGDAEQEYFVDGMTEALIAELAQIRSLQVRGRTSVMQYKATTLSIPEIAVALNVDGIVEGSVVREGDQVRITAQLVHGPSDTHRWAGTFDSTLSSILQLHSEMALAIANEVRAHITPEEEARIADAELVNREAYDLYLQGWSFGGQFSPEGLQQRLDYFRRSTEIDPEFAPAWVGRAVVHNVIAGFGFGPSGGHYEALHDAARRALELDDTLPRAYSVLGFHDVARRWDWEAARANFDKSVALDPDAPNTHFIRGYYRLHSGDWAGADADALLALDLDPHATLPRVMGGFVLANTHDRERGFEILEQLIADEPQNQLAHYWLSSAYARSGRVDSAVRVATRLAESLSENPHVQVNLAYCLSFGDPDQREQAGHIVEGLGAVPTNLIPAPLLAQYYANIGDLDAAFEWFERAAADPNMLLLTCLRLSPLDPGAYPNLDRFYRDPRYWALVERIGFPALPAGHPLYAYQEDWNTMKADTATNLTEPAEAN